MRLLQMKRLQNLLLILLGNTIYCLAVVMFILPNQLITGGTTGLGLFFNHSFSIPVEYTVGIFNIIMFLLGALILGIPFALTTLISTFYYPIILGVLQKIPTLQNMTTDPMLSSVMGGIMIGFGIGIVIRAGASTGGIDIPPLILNKKFRIPVSVTLYALDFTILILQMFYTNKEKVLYGIFMVLTYTIVLDRILLMGKSQTQVKIISKEYEKINCAIQTNLDRGTTLLHMESGYLHKDSFAILTIVSSRELNKLNEIVMGIDKNAFMIINQVNEVHGHGFTTEKLHL